MPTITIGANIATQDAKGVSPGLLAVCKPQITVIARNVPAKLADSAKLKLSNIMAVI